MGQLTFVTMIQTEKKHQHEQNEDKKNHNTHR